MGNVQNAEKTAQNAGSPLTVLGVGAHEAPAGKDFPPHRHHCWELVYYRRGYIQAPVGDECYEVEPGMLLLTPPNTVHAEYARTAYANFFLTVDAPAEQPWARVCRDDSGGTLAYLFAALTREWQSVSDERARMLALLLEQLDIFLRRTRLPAPQSEPERLVQQMEQLIQERSAGPLCLRDLSREVGASPSLLRRHFVCLRGQPPRAYLQAVRVRHALALIRSSTLTLETVADLCGYDSASHLSRCIKCATGQSPGKLRGHLL